MQVYFDESSFSTDAVAQRTWQKKSRALVLEKPAKRWGRLTIFGGVGNCLKKPVFSMAPKTSKEDTLEFLQMVKANLTHNCKPWLVYDQHQSH